jgi:hypothetical protein
MKIYLLCEHVDLGYQVKKVYIDIDKANNSCNDMNNSYMLKEVNALIEYCNYTEEVARKYVRPVYFIEEHECE